MRAKGYTWGYAVSSVRTVSCTENWPNLQHPKPKKIRLRLTLCSAKVSMCINEFLPKKDAITGALESDVPMLVHMPAVIYPEGIDFHC